MAVDMGSLFMRNLGELRAQPTRKRVRAKIDGETIVDSSRAVLAWEPKRVVPAYAVPVDDVVGGTRPTPDPADGDGDPTEVTITLGEGWSGVWLPTIGALQSMTFETADARAKAFEGIASFSFPGAQWRRDIAAEPLGVVEGAAAKEKNS